MNPFGFVFGGIKTVAGMFLPDFILKNGTSSTVQSDAKRGFQEFRDNPQEFARGKVDQFGREVDFKNIKNPRDAWNTAGDVKRFFTPKGAQINTLEEYNDGKILQDQHQGGTNGVVQNGGRNTLLVLDELPAGTQKRIMAAVDEMGGSDRFINKTQSTAVGNQVVESVRLERLGDKAMEARIKNILQEDGLLQQNQSTKSTAGDAQPKAQTNTNSANAANDASKGNTNNGSQTIQTRGAFTDVFRPGQHFDNLHTDVKAIGSEIRNQGLGALKNSSVQAGIASAGVRASVGLGIANVIKHTGLGLFHCLPFTGPGVGEHFGQAKDHAVGLGISGVVMAAVGKAASITSKITQGAASMFPAIGQAASRLVPAFARGFLSRVPVLGGVITYAFGRNDISAMEDAVKNGTATQEMLDNTRKAVYIQSVGNLMPIPFVGDLLRDGFNLTCSRDAKPGFGFTGSLVAGVGGLVGLGESKPMSAPNSGHVYRTDLANAPAMQTTPVVPTTETYTMRPASTPNISGMSTVRAGRF